MRRQNETTTQAQSIYEFLAHNESNSRIASFLITTDLQGRAKGFEILVENSSRDFFIITLDFYKIEIEDAIIDVQAQDIADNCVDAIGGPDEGYCSAIDRDPTTFDVEFIRTGYINASRRFTEGLELDINYGMDLDSAGTLDLSLFINHLLEFDRFEFQDRPDEINVEVGDPEW